MNRLERLKAGLSPQDEFLEAILETQQTQLMQILAELERSGDILERQIEGEVDTTDLPTGLSGRAAQDIDQDNRGTAVFDVAGGSYLATVEASEPVSRFDPVTVTDEGRNTVKVSGEFEQVEEVNISGSSRTFKFDGSSYLVRPAIETDDVVAVANEKWDQSDDTRDTVDDTLAANGAKVFAEIDLDDDHFLLLERTNATQHDGVEYNYYLGGSGTDDIDADLSGSSTWAEPPNWFYPNPDGFVIVEDYLAVEIDDQDGNQHSGVSAALTGRLYERK